MSAADRDRPARRRSGFENGGSGVPALKVGYSPALKGIGLFNFAPVEPQALRRRRSPRTPTAMRRIR
jgi:hypothetical protein